MPTSRSSRGLGWLRTPRHAPLRHTLARRVHVRGPHRLSGRVACAGGAGDCRNGAFHSTLKPHHLRNRRCTVDAASRIGLQSRLRPNIDRTKTVSQPRGLLAVRSTPLDLANKVLPKLARKCVRVQRTSHRASIWTQHAAGAMIHVTAPCIGR